MAAESKVHEKRNSPGWFRRHLPIWWWCLVVLGIAIAIVGGRFDRAFCYIVLFTTVLVASLIALIRHLRVGEGRLAIRAMPLLLFLACLVAATQVLRVDDVTGNLVPTRIAFVWQPRRDQLLEVPVARRGRAGAELGTTTSDDYPQFLGPHRNAALDGPTLATNWNEQPPKLVWRKEVFGAGWSAFAAVNGYAVTQEQRDDQEIVSCYEVDTGRAVWVTATHARHETVPGGVGPRATPTIADGFVYTVGATGLLQCLDGSDGEVVWRRDLLAEIGTTVEQDVQRVAWGRSASPLIDGRRVIVPLGQPDEGEQGASLAAFDADSGDLLWKQGPRQVSYSSPMITTLDGIRQIVIICEDVVCGHDAESGQPLWEYPWPGKSNGNATCSQPLDAGRDRLFFSKGYGIGAALVQVRQASPNRWAATEIWHRRTVMKTKFSNPVIYQDHVYGLDDGILSCVDLETGERRWKRGRYGHGQILRVGELFLVQAESGDVCLVAINPTRYEELSRFSALDGKTWNNPCLYGNILLVRNSEQAACYELPLR